MVRNIVCIAAGASAGATIRWVLGLAMNGVFPSIPLGTLAANLSGGYLMGIMLGAVAAFPQLSSEMRLLLMTGFLGSLTTFSTFSGEVLHLIMNRQLLTAFTAAFLHLAGSLSMTALGLACFNYSIRFFR